MLPKIPLPYFFSSFLFVEPVGWLTYGVYRYFTYCS